MWFQLTESIAVFIMRVLEKTQTSGCGLKTPQKRFLSMVNRGSIHIIEKNNQPMLLTRIISQYSSSQLRKFSVANLTDHFTVVGFVVLAFE